MDRLIHIPIQFIFLIVEPDESLNIIEFKCQSIFHSIHTKDVNKLLGGITYELHLGAFGVVIIIHHILP